MIKSDELVFPFSCLNRAHHDEPIFVLLGRDLVAPDAIRDWVERRIYTGKNKRDDPQIKEALMLADQMIVYYVRLHEKDPK